MNEPDKTERAVALVDRALDVLLRAEEAPHSPVNTFLTAKMRRQLRRAAKRLRRGEVEPRYKNLHSAESLAAIYERTARRDEILEQTGKELQAITRDLAPLFETPTPELEKRLETMLIETARSAEEDGPGSRAERRFRQMMFIAALAHRNHSQKRRQRTPAPLHIPLADPSIEERYAVTAAEVLSAPPSSGEPIIAIPPEDESSGRERVLFRIGLGHRSWVGSFECGDTDLCTVVMMPDGKHLFVAADGAGYIVDATSHTLVERTGTQAIGTIQDERRGLLVVVHQGT